MEQNTPWEANRSSVRQEIPCILWNQWFLTAFTSAHLSQSRPVHTSLSHFLKIHCNIIFHSSPRSSKWFLSLMFSHKPCMHLSSPPMHVTCPAHLILLNLITRMIFGGECRSLLFSTIFPKSFSLCSSLDVSNQGSYLDRTTGRIIVLCNLT